MAAKARKHRTYRDVGTLFQCMLVPHPFPDKLPDGSFLIHAESNGPFFSIKDSDHSHLLAARSAFMWHG